MWYLFQNHLYFCSKITITDKILCMIRDFWVKNYLSIRDKQELSFVAKGPSSELSEFTF